MHEVGIVRGFVNAALEAAEKHQAARITSLSVVIGELANITDDAVRFNFEILSNGTPAQGATVTIRRESRRATCRDCGVTNPVGMEPVCPSCGSVRMEVSGGHQCYLESIDVE